MNLVIFHYHIEPGGVSSVIRQAVLALSSNSVSISSVTILTGRANENFAEKLQSLSQIPVTIDVYAELGYISDMSKKQRKKPKIIKQKIQEILKHYTSEHNIWWMHNYHLGKNPIFTATLIHTLINTQAQRCILHIHDSPENGRFLLFKNLAEDVDVPLYPIGSNIRYAVISSHSRSILVNAGIPEKMVYFVPNPVLADNTVRLTYREKQAIREKLAAMNTHSHTYDPEKPHALYPVRTIRRKNVLEAALFLKCFNAGVNLIVTLPGISDLEKPYSDLVSHAFAEQLIQGMWGIGVELDKPEGVSFQQLFALSDIVISSSIQEGFGYQYISALSWQKPLFARFVPPMEDMADLINAYPHVIYNSFKVPVTSPTLGNIREQIHNQYHAQLVSIKDTAKMELQEYNRLQESYEQLMRTEDVDFCHLPPSVQYCYITDAKDPGFRTDIMELNHKLYKNFSMLPGSACPDMSTSINTYFGASSFAESFAKVIKALDSPIQAFASQAAVEKKVFEAFCTPMLFSPLYTTYAGEGN